MNLAGNEDLDDDGVEVPREGQMEDVGKLQNGQCFTHGLLSPLVKGDESVFSWGESIHVFFPK